MSDPKSLMRRYTERVSRREFEGIRQLCHDDYSYTGANGQRQDGPEAAVAMARTYTSAFPDLQFDIKHMHLAGDDTLVTEFVVRGTHRGELMGIGATNRAVEIPVCNVIEVRDGRIYAEREYFDFSYVLQQLGVPTGVAHA